MQNTPAQACAGVFLRYLYGAVNAVHRNFAGEDVLLAAVGAHHQTALFVYVDGLSGALPAVRQIEGDPAAQVDAGGLVFLPEGRKAVPGKGVQIAVKAEVRQPLGQPGRVGVQIDLGSLQGQRGAVGRRRRSSSGAGPD